MGERPGKEAWREEMPKKASAETGDRRQGKELVNELSWSFKRTV
jgi:hypothetical protein